MTLGEQEKELKNPIIRDMKKKTRQLSQDSTTETLII